MLAFSPALGVIVFQQPSDGLPLGSAQLPVSIKLAATVYGKIINSVRLFKKFHVTITGNRCENTADVRNEVHLESLLPH